MKLLNTILNIDTQWHNYPFWRLKIGVETFEHSIKRTNESKVPKVVAPNNKKRYCKILGTSVINSPLSPFFSDYFTCRGRVESNTPPKILLASRPWILRTLFNWMVGSCTVYIEVNTIWTQLSYLGSNAINFVRAREKFKQTFGFPGALYSDFQSRYSIPYFRYYFLRTSAVFRSLLSTLNYVMYLKRTLIS